MTEFKSRHCGTQAAARKRLSTSAPRLTGFEGIMPMHTVLSLAFQALRRAVVLLTCCVIAPGFSASAADRWTDISSPLLERLTNSGAKPPWPGGCSGLVVNRTNGV